MAGREQKKSIVNKLNNKKQKFMIGSLLAIIVVLIFVIVFLSSQLNKKLEVKADRDWLIQNCQCVEWEGEKRCPSGFEFLNDTCVNNTEKKFTNFLVACSKYECENYLVDLKPS